MENNIITNENQDNDRKIEIDSLIDSIIKENKKYKSSEFLRDIFSDTINTLKEEGKIVPLSNQEAKDIFEIWSKSIKSNEDFYNIINTIEKHCDKEGIDYIMALYSVYIKNQFYYICKFTNDRAYYDHDIKVSYFYRIDLMNFIRYRIRHKYNKEINVEDNIANMLNFLDDNTNNTDSFFDLSTAKEQNFNAFYDIKIERILKYNSYTCLLEKVIKKETTKVNSQIIDQTKEELATKNTNYQDTTSDENNLKLGSYNPLQTKKLYEECKDEVFKNCKLEVFVNSLNNPEECKLEVKNKNLLYVFYTYFFNLFGDEAEDKIGKLNEKFNISKETYAKKKSSYKNYTTRQKDFDNILGHI